MLVAHVRKLVISELVGHDVDDVWGLVSEGCRMAPKEQNRAKKKSNVPCRESELESA